MAKKNDMNTIMEKYRPMLQKFGDDLGKAAKKGEKAAVRMSKVLKIELDMLGTNLQKEKLYHELGKHVAKKLADESFDLPGLEKYKKRLEKINSEGESMKKKLKSIGKKKTSKKK